MILLIQYLALVNPYSGHGPIWNRDVLNAEPCIIQDLILVVGLTMRANYHSFYLSITRVG